MSKINAKPKISIITATFNSISSIHRLILSLSCQNYKNFEWIIVDGGSTDGTLDVIRNVPNINIILDSRSDSGVYDALNRSLTFATGEYYIFLGADDYLICDLMDVSSRLIDNRTIYYGDSYMPKRHVLYDGIFSPYKLVFENICHQSIFYPSSVFLKYKYNTKYKIWADYYLNIQCMSDIRYSFSYIPVLVSFYNDRFGLSSNQCDLDFIKDRDDIVKKYFPKRVFVYFLIKKIMKSAVHKSIKLLKI